jgi:hypothetical protein
MSGPCAVESAGGTIVAMPAARRGRLVGFLPKPSNSRSRTRTAKAHRQICRDSERSPMVLQLARSSLDAREIARIAASRLCRRLAKCGVELRMIRSLRMIAVFSSTRQFLRDFMSRFPAVSPPSCQRCRMSRRAGRPQRRRRNKPIGKPAPADASSDASHDAPRNHASSSGCFSHRRVDTRKLRQAWRRAQASRDRTKLYLPMAWECLPALVLTVVLAIAADRSLFVALAPRL